MRNEFETSPAFQRIASEAMARDQLEREQARADSAAALVEIDNWHAAEIAKLEKPRRALVENIRKLEDALAERHSALRKADHALQQLACERLGRRQQHIRVMSATIPAAWEKFFAELQALENETRAAHRARPRRCGLFAMLGGSARGEETNAAAIQTRLSAIVAVKREAENLMREYVGNPQDIIAALRGKIPATSTLSAYTDTAETSILKNLLHFRSSKA